jgi:hypothetical protein
MRGTILPLPNTPSWRGAYLSTGTTLPLPSYHKRFLKVTCFIIHNYLHCLPKLVDKA